MTAEATAPDWHAEGTIFESCNCALLCRCHIHYSNPSDYDNCLFYWAIHIDRGSFGNLSLDDLNVVIVGKTPKQMLDGNWTQAIYLDARAGEGQRGALERIFTGAGGGAWTVLAGFVGERLETLHVPISYVDEGGTKSMEIENWFSASVEAIHGGDRENEAKLINLFNQIHGNEHILALGSTTHESREPRMTMKDTNALYSRFSWSGP